MRVPGSMGRGTGLVCACALTSLVTSVVNSFVDAVIVFPPFENSIPFGFLLRQRIRWQMLAQMVVALRGASSLGRCFRRFLAQATQEQSIHRKRARPGQQQ